MAPVPEATDLLRSRRHRRGRPRRSRWELAARVHARYAHWLPVFQWLHALSRDLRAEWFVDAIAECGIPWRGSLDSFGYDRLARRLVCDAPAGLTLALVARDLKVTHAAAQHLLREARRQRPDLEAEVSAQSACLRQLAVWRRYRRPWALSDEESDRLDVELARVARSVVS